MSGRARRKRRATRARPAKRATRPLLNGYGTTRHGTPMRSQDCATGPGLLKPQTSTSAFSCSTKWRARMSACRSAPPSSRLKSTKTMRRPLRVEFVAGVKAGSAFFGKRGTHLLQDAARSRIPKPVRVDHLSIVDRDAQFADAASDGFDFNSVFFFQLCRHPGSNCSLGESDRATADNYLSHKHIPFKPAAPTARPARKHVRKASYRQAQILS